MLCFRYDRLHVYTSDLANYNFEFAITDELFILTRFCERGSLKKYLCEDLQPKYYPGGRIQIITELKRDELGYSAIQDKS